MYLKINTKLSQKLQISPQVIQSARVLSLPLSELGQAIHAELESNPVLEEKLNVTDSSGVAEKNKEDVSEWTQYTSFQSIIPTIKNRQKDATSSSQFIEEHSYSSETLRDHLMWQISLSGFTKEQKKILLLMVEEIDEDGYFKTSLKDLNLKYKVSIDQLEQSLSQLQELDPAGVAARNLKECLIIQAKRAEEDTRDVIDMIENHLEDLHKKRYPKIAHLLNISVEEVMEIFKIIKAFDPRPGKMFSSHLTQYVVPDIYIQKNNEGRYVSTINEEGIPQLRVASHYKQFLNKMQDRSVKYTKTQEYLVEKMKRALGFIHSLNQRRQMLFNLAQIIASEQASFFDTGDICFLRPFLLKDMAEKLNVHISTISRVTRSKYVHTPQGVFELKYFFGVSYINQKGEKLSVNAIKFMIKNLIQNETEPLSDEKIKDIFLKKEGLLNVSRRLVGRLREELNIPNATERRSLKIHE